MKLFFLTRGFEHRSATLQAVDGGIDGDPTISQKRLTRDKRQRDV